MQISCSAVDGLHQEDLWQVFDGQVHRQAAYLDGLRKVFDGQEKPDAQFQRENVLPVRSVLKSKTTNN